MTCGLMTTTSLTVYRVVAIIYSVTPFWVTKIRPLQPRQVVSCDKKKLNDYEGLCENLVYNVQKEKANRRLVFVVQVSEWPEWHSLKNGLKSSQWLSFNFLLVGVIN